MKKPVWTLIFCVLTLATANLPIAGQIKIPKIFRPKQDQPMQVPAIQTPTNAGDNRRPSGGQPETISETRGNYVDDGFTWFEAISTQELNAQHRPVTTGWALSSEIRLTGDYPRRSAFKINVSRAGKILSSNRCEAYPLLLEPGKPGVNYVVTSACVDKTKTIKELGKFDVEVIAINGDTDAETPVRNYKIEVLKVERIAGGVSNPQPDAPHYYISRHAEAPISFMFLRPNGADSYVPKNEFPQWNGVEIYYSLSPSDKGKSNADSYVQCSVNGAPIDLGGGRVGDELDSSTAKNYEVVYTDRLAAPYKTGGTEFRDDIAFRLVRITLPFQWGSNASRFSMSAHPGKWECSMTNTGEKWRTWRWTIGANGMPVKHAEQNGNVNLTYNSYLLDMDIPAGGTVLDKRLVPTSATEGFFYGQKWISPEGKAMAAKTPTKGRAFPVPSNQIK